MKVSTGRSMLARTQQWRRIQRRIKVGAEEICFDELTDIITGEETIRRIVAVRWHFGLVFREKVSNRRDEEPACATGGIEHPLVGLWIEHPHHQLDGPTRGEVLTSVTP